MKEIINATKNSGEVYDHLAHYLFNQMAKAHYKPGDFDVLSPWAWMSIFGWILSFVALTLVIMLRIKVRSLTMLVMARAAHALPLETARKLPKGVTPVVKTPDGIAEWAQHIAHVQNLLPAKVLILLILIGSDHLEKFDF